MPIKKCPKCSGPIDTELADMDGSIVCTCGAKLRLGKPNTFATKSSQASQPPISSEIKPTDSSLPDFGDVPPDFGDVPNSFSTDWNGLLPPAATPQIGINAVNTTSNTANVRSSMPTAAQPAKKSPDKSKAIVNKEQAEGSSSKKLPLIVGGIGLGVFTMLAIAVLSIWSLMGQKQGNAAAKNEPVENKAKAIPGKEPTLADISSVIINNRDAIVRMDSTKLVATKQVPLPKNINFAFESEGEFVAPAVDFESLQLPRLKLPAMGEMPSAVEPLTIEDSTALRKSLNRTQSGILFPTDPTAVLIRRDEPTSLKVPMPTIGEGKKKMKLLPNQEVMEHLWHGYEGATVEVLDLRTGKILGEYFSTVFSRFDFALRRLAPDGSTLLAHVESLGNPTDPNRGRLTVYELTNFKTFRRIDLPCPIEWYDYFNATTVMCLGFRESIPVLLFISVKDGKILKEIACPQGSAQPTKPILDPNRDSGVLQRAHIIALHPSRKWVAMASGGKLTMINLVNGAITGPMELRCGNRELSAIGFSADGKKLIGNFPVSPNSKKILTYQWALADGELEAIVSCNQEYSSDSMLLRPEINSLGFLNMAQKYLDNGASLKWSFLDRQTGQVRLEGPGFLYNAINDHEFLHIDAENKLSILDITSPEFKPKEFVEQVVDPRISITPLQGFDAPATKAMPAKEWNLAAIPKLQSLQASQIYLSKFPQAWSDLSGITVELPNIHPENDPKVYLEERDLKSGKLTRQAIFSTRLSAPYQAIAEVTLFEKNPYSLPVRVAMPNDGRFVAIIDPAIGNEIVLLDQQRKPTATLQLPKQAIADWITFVEDRILLVLIGGELWGIDVVDRKVLYRIDGGYHHHAVSRWKHWIVAVAKPNGIDLVDGRTGQIVGELLANKPGGEYRGLSFSPDGLYFVGARVATREGNQAKSQIDVWDLRTGKLARELQSCSGVPIVWISDSIFFHSDPQYPDSNFLFDVRNEAPIAKGQPSGLNMLQSPDGMVWKPCYNTSSPAIRPVFANNVLVFSSDPNAAILSSPDCEFRNLSKLPIELKITLDSKARSQELADRLAQSLVNQGYTIGANGLVLSVTALGKKIKVDPALMTRFERENRRTPIEGVVTVNGKALNAPFVDADFSLEEPKLGMLKSQSKQFTFQPEYTRFRSGSRTNENDKSKIDLSFNFGPNPENAIADELFDQVAKHLDVQPVLPSGPFATDGKTSIALPIESQLQITKSEEAATVDFKLEGFE